MIQPVSFIDTTNKFLLDEQNKPSKFTDLLTVCNVLSITALLVVGVATYILADPFQRYYTPPDLRGRNLTTLDKETINLNCFSSLQQKTILPSFFLQQDLANEKPFEITYKSNQCPITTMKRLDYENLIQKVNPHGGITHSLMLLDEQHQPIAIFKKGHNYGGDIIARRIAEHSNGLLKAPQVSQGDINSHGSGLIIEYIPHFEGTKMRFFGKYTLEDFKNVSKESMQCKAFFDLLIDNRDPHGSNLLITHNGELITIDHDHSLRPRGFQNIAALIRDVENIKQTSWDDIILYKPFWMKIEYVEKVMGPIDPKLSSWILSLDLKNILSSVEEVSDGLSISLNTRLKILQLAVRENVDLPDLYHYLTPSISLLKKGETIANDYIAAIELAAQSVLDPKKESDDTLNSAFLFYFSQIAALRVKVFAGKLSLEQFQDKMQLALNQNSK